MDKSREELAPEEADELERRDIEERLYTMLDGGLGKRDAYALLELIERFVDLKLRMQGRSAPTA